VTKIFRVLFLVLAVVLVTGSARAEYLFIKVVDSPTSNSLISPYINNVGQVAYWSLDALGRHTVNFWDSATGATTNVFTASLPPSGTNNESLSFRPSLNDLGQVAYAFRESGVGGVTQSLRVWNSTSNTTQTYLSLNSSIGDPTIGDNGTLAYSRANSGTPTTSNAYSVNASGSVQDFGRTGSPFPSINASGNLAFGQGANAIVVGSSPSNSQSIVAPNFLIGPGIAISDSGTVAFTAVDNSSAVTSSSVYTASVGSAPTLVASGADFQGLASGVVSINSANNLAFLGTPVGGTRGLYSTAQGLSTPIIRVGDAFDGSIVTGLGMGIHGLNDALNVAFLATLQDGRTGIYFGVVAVPEPSSLPLASIAFLGIFTRRSRNSQRPMGS
jgi:hypothetical protein